MEMKKLGGKSDLNFHLALAASTQNSLVSNLLLHVSDLMQETMKETRGLWLLSKWTTTEKLFEEHVEIYQAVQEQNGKRLE